MGKGKDESLCLACTRTVCTPPHGQTWDLLEGWGGGGGTGEQGAALVAVGISAISALGHLHLLPRADKSANKKRKEGIISVNFVARTWSSSHVHSGMGLDLLTWF